jgi:hypothetical protein
VPKDPADALRLADEYDDLAEEYFDCGDHDERVRCWARMTEITSALDPHGAAQFADPGLAPDQGRTDEPAHGMVGAHAHR